MYDWNLIVPDFKNGTQSGNEVRVHCPFHNDENKSASINLEKGAFYCQTCAKKGVYLENELTKLFKIDLEDKKNILSKLQSASSDIIFKETKNKIKSKEYTLQPTQMLELCKKYKYKPKVLQDLKVYKNPKYELSDFSIPAYFFGEIVATKTYFGEAFAEGKYHTKWLMGKNSLAKMFLPFDYWRETLNKNIYNDNRTYIVAGEKDMLTMRSHGFNALTLLGGEGTIPLLDSSWFKDLEIVIIYDNDLAGKAGAKRIAKYFYKSTDKVRVLDNIFEIIKENKEDVYDFFNKYGKTKDDLLRLVQESPFLQLDQEIEEDITQLKKTKLHTIFQMNDFWKNDDYVFLYTLLKKIGSISLNQWSKIEVLDIKNKVRFLQMFMKNELIRLEKNENNNLIITLDKSLVD